MAEKRNPFPERGALSARFRATTPDLWREIVGDPDKTRDVRVFEERWEAMRRRVAEHHARHKARWIDQEFARIVLAKMAPAPAPRPKGVRVNLQEYRAEAARRVAARFEARKQRLDRAHANMVARVMSEREAARARPDKALARELVERVHETVARAQRLRVACNAHFKKHRSEWIAAAHTRGSENPLEETYRNRVARMRSITTAEANILRNAFERAGGDHAPARVETLSQRHIQSM